MLLFSRVLMFLKRQESPLFLKRLQLPPAVYLREWQESFAYFFILFKFKNATGCAFVWSSHLPKSATLVGNPQCALSPIVRFRLSPTALLVETQLKSTFPRSWWEVTDTLRACSGNGTTQREHCSASSSCLVLHSLLICVYFFLTGEERSTYHTYPSEGSKSFQKGHLSTHLSKHTSFVVEWLILFSFSWLTENLSGPWEGSHKVGSEQ